MKPLVLATTLSKPGEVSCTYNSSTWEVEAGGPVVHDPSQLHIEFQARLGYSRTGLKTKQDPLPITKTLASTKVTAGGCIKQRRGMTGVMEVKMNWCLKPRHMVIYSKSGPRWKQLRGWKQWCQCACKRAERLELWVKRGAGPSKTKWSLGNTSRAGRAR